jgi:FkbM family methyltransferase
MTCSFLCAWLLAAAPAGCETAPELGDSYREYTVPGVGKFLLDDNPGLVKRFLRQGRPWEPHIVDAIRISVPEGSTVVDVGAHVGSLTLPMAKAVGEKGKVYAFEPQHLVHAELCKSVELNDYKNVHVLRAALGESTGTVSMNTKPGRDGISRVGPGDSVPLKTLDSFELRDVSFIKIDVEGYGVPMLRGALETIRRWHPVIVIEMGREWEEGAQPLLEGMGYDFRQLRAVDYIATWQGEPATGRPPAPPVE